LKRELTSSANGGGVTPRFRPRQSGARSNRQATAAPRCRATHVSSERRIRDAIEKLADPTASVRESCSHRTLPEFNQDAGLQYTINGLHLNRRATN